MQQAKPKMKDCGVIAAGTRILAASILMLGVTLIDYVVFSKAYESPTTEMYVVAVLMAMMTAGGLWLTYYVLKPLFSGEKEGEGSV